jgi:NADP-reducing hydrogenase subunit HndB
MNEPKKIRTLKDLQEIRERVSRDTSLREEGYHACVTVHMGTCGIASGARDILACLADELAASDRRDVRMTTSGCIGVCEHEPVMTVEVLGKGTVLYGDLDPDKAKTIFHEHILGGKIVPQFVVGFGSEQPSS